MLKTHAPDTLTALLDGAWAQRLAHMAQPQCLEEDRRFAVYVVCDALEFGPGGDDAARARAASLIPVLLESCAPETPAARRQAACYGLGVAATALQAHFAPYAATAVRALVQLMAARPDASATAACLPVEGFGDDDSDYEDVSDDDDGNAVQEALVADNAASALARVLVVSCPDAGAWSLWVQYMPLLADCTEADAALTCLCEGIRTGSLPAPLNLVVACLGRCAVALKAGAHGTTARGTSPTEFDGARHRLARAWAAVQQAPGSCMASGELSEDALQALVECTL